MLRDELRLGGRDEPDIVVLVAIEVLVEVRQVRRRDERLLARDERRIDLGEAGVDLQIDHPRDERALQRRAGAAQVVEAGTRELHAARDVEDAKRLAHLPVRLRREAEIAFAVLAHDAVVVFILARRNTGSDVIGDPQRQLVALGLKGAELRVDLLDLVAHLAHSRLHRVARRAALARLVSLGLEQLFLRAELAALRVELEDPIQWRVEVTRRNPSWHAPALTAAA